MTTFTQTERRRVALSTGLLGSLAAIGPLLFAAIVVALTAEEWHFMHQLGWKAVGKTNVPWPSGLALGPYGWAQVLNFLLLGGSLIALATALGRVVPAARWTRRLLYLWGTIFALSAFKTDPDTSHITTWHGAIHAAMFVLMLPTAVITMLVAWRGLRGDARFGRLSQVSLIAGIVLLGLIVVSLGADGGLGFYFLLGVLLSWLVLLALALRRGYRVSGV